MGCGIGPNDTAALTHWTVRGEGPWKVYWTFVDSHNLEYVAHTRDGLNKFLEDKEEQIVYEEHE